MSRRKININKEKNVKENTIMKSQEIYESYMKVFSERWELEKK